MPRGLINAVVSILTVMALASCGDKPPRPDPEGHNSYSNVAPQNPAYGRTVRQGESERMGN